MKSLLSETQPAISAGTITVCRLRRNPLCKLRKQCQYKNVLTEVPGKTKTPQTKSAGFGNNFLKWKLSRAFEKF
jgi:hypothetical protein